MSSVTLPDLKRLARLKYKKENLPNLAAAQEAVAREHGYRDWFHARRTLSVSEVKTAPVLLKLSVIQVSESLLAAGRMQWSGDDAVKFRKDLTEILNFKLLDKRFQVEHTVEALKKSLEESEEFYDLESLRDHFVFHHPYIDEDFFTDVVKSLEKKPPAWLDIQIGTGVNEGIKLYSWKEEPLNRFRIQAATNGVVRVIAPDQPEDSFWNTFFTTETKEEADMLVVTFCSRSRTGDEMILSHDDFDPEASMGTQINQLAKIARMFEATQEYRKAPTVGGLREYLEKKGLKKPLFSPATK